VCGRRPCTRPIERFGDIVAYPIVGGLIPSIRTNLDFGSDRDYRGKAIDCRRGAADLRQHCEVAGTAEGAGVIPASLPPHPSRLPSDRVLSERGNESEP
jgi:hypothetical protein